MKNIHGHRYYTGVGSRETPDAVMTLMTELALVLARNGYRLRSGGADGADSAFEAGALAAGPDCADIFLPWPGFNARQSRYQGASDEARAIASKVHPAWERLGQGPRKLHARNVHQVLGEKLDAPSDFLVCWTPDGCESERQRTQASGGTATAVVLAERYGVPRYNLAQRARRIALRDALAAKGLDVGSLPWDVGDGIQSALF